MLIHSPKYSFSLFIIIFLSFLIRLLFLGQHDLLVEEAYYWNYAVHLDFGYLDHPPMIAALIRCATWFFGTNEFAVRFPALICWLITTYYSYQWCELVQKGTGPFAV
ncbi:MAG TPA: glycosyltransferase family 39 protein, partial [Legionellaceae bacterium]|nr:glycosyltransferase family 39 protein [Legionellaceae bacterium]